MNRPQAVHRREDAAAGDAAMRLLEIALAIAAVVAAVGLGLAR